MPKLIPCPSCNSFDLKPFSARIRESSPHTLRTVCKRCGLIFANPQGTDEELSLFYQNYYDKGNFQGWKQNVLLWKEEVDSKINSTGFVVDDDLFTRIMNHTHREIRGQKWLEVGAGLGQLSYLAKTKGFCVTVTDLDPDAISFIREVMGIENAFPVDVTKAHFPDESFDVVVMHHVLEHVTDLFGTLGKIYSLLKPGGLFYIGVPNLGSSGYEIYRYLSFLSLHVPDIVDGIEHTYGFTPRTLTNSLRKSGFEVKWLATYGKGHNLVEKFKQGGVKKAVVAIAENIFHTKMECVAIKPIGKGQ